MCLSHFIVCAFLQMFGGHVVNGINDVIAVGGVAVLRGEPPVGNLARQTHGAHRSSGSFQRVAGVGGDKSRRQGRKLTARAGDAAHHGVAVADAVGFLRIGYDVDSTGNGNHCAGAGGKGLGKSHGAVQIFLSHLVGYVCIPALGGARTGAVVAITGAIDIVADAQKAYCIRNGNAMMSSITGTGCQLSALTAAFVTANPGQPLEAAAAAVCAMGLAGEIAHQRLTPQDGNATYRNYIIDAIYNMTPEQLEKGANYEVR